MPDEFLLDPDEKFHIRLERAVEEYLRNYDIPKSKEAEYWLDHPNFEEVLDEYFLGSGGTFSVADWERWITNIYEIEIVPRGTGLWVTFEFFFDNGDESPGSGTRSAYGKIR